MLNRRFTVFEAVNDTIKEIFLGTTDAGMEEVVDQHQASLPERIAHWKPDHRVRYRGVEFMLTAGQARKRVVSYGRAVDRPGWTVVSGPPDPRPS